eukprot:7790284-Alexandrium_andersonii.AAC.1
MQKPPAASRAASNPREVQALGGLLGRLLARPVGVLREGEHGSRELARAPADEAAIVLRGRAQQVTHEAADGTQGQAPLQEGRGNGELLLATLPLLDGARDRGVGEEQLPGRTV